MNRILSEFSDQALTTAIEANLFELFRFFRYWGQAQVYDDSDMLWSITNIPFPLFNSILRAQFEPESVQTSIERAVSRCKARNVPMLWWTGPATRPANLGVYLQAHDFVHVEDEVGMAVDLGTLIQGLPTPATLTIEVVADRAALETWSQTLLLGYEMPDFVGNELIDLFAALGFDAHSPIRNYIGRLRGIPVATSTLCLAAGVAGIYDVATVPEARRQGIGAAMTRIPLQEARIQGYRVGVLQATEMAVGLYHQLGFQDYCIIGQYVWPSEPANDPMC